MKTLAPTIFLVVLSSCTSAPTIHSSFNGGYGTSYTTGPTSANDPRLFNRNFYTDSNDSIPWLKYAEPITNK